MFNTVCGGGGDGGEKRESEPIKRELIKEIMKWLKNDLGFRGTGGRAEGIERARVRREKEKKRTSRFMLLSSHTDTHKECVNVHV